MASSGLADWEGDISGALDSSSIPNRTSIETLEIGTHVTNIKSSAFSSCNNIKNVIIPSSVSSINEQAFLNCEALSSLTLYPGISEIGKYAFASNTTQAALMSSLTNLIIPSSITCLGPGSFYKNIEMTDVTIDSTTLSGGVAFYSCSKLSNVVFTGSTLSLTANNMFGDCSSLVNVNFHRLTTS